MGDAARGASARRLALEERLAALSGRVARVAERFRAVAERLPGFLTLLLTSTAAWILLWAWYDVMILARAFPSAPGYRPDLNVYWTSTWWVLFPITSLLVFRRHAWLPILALAIAGWEDVLFYWVQGHPVPSALAYLPQTPTADALYLRAALFFVPAVAGAILARLPALRIRFVPIELVMLAAGILGSFWIFAASIPAYLAARRGLTHLARRPRNAVPADR